ncbi:MAG: hypothetical protein ABWY25_07305 [Paenisporosarcina sp.]
MTSERIQEIIEHYGTKGMRWGVRTKNKGGTAKTKYKTSPKDLTNEELNRRVKRLETEKRYNELNSGSISAGQKLATEILTNSGRTFVTTVLGGAALYGTKKLIQKKFGEDAANFITKRKK